MTKRRQNDTNDKRQSNRATWPKRQTVTFEFEELKISGDLWYYITTAPSKPWTVTIRSTWEESDKKEMRSSLRKEDSDA